MAIERTSPARFGLHNPQLDVSKLSRPRLTQAKESSSTLLYEDLYIEKKLQTISEREGEDAVVTGGTRSLHRRLLALNIQELPRVSSVRATQPKLQSA